MCREDTSSNNIAFEFLSSTYRTHYLRIKIQASKIDDVTRYFSKASSKTNSSRSSLRKNYRDGHKMLSSLRLLRDRSSVEQPDETPRSVPSRARGDATLLLPLHAEESASLPGWRTLSQIDSDSFHCHGVVRTQQRLRPGERETLHKSGFDGEKPLKIIIHGYMGHGNEKWLLVAFFFLLLVCSIGPLQEFLGWILFETRIPFENSMKHDGAIFSNSLIRIS